MNSMTMKSVALLALFVLLALVGCSDANAATTSTYLPVDEPCPFEDVDQREAMLEIPDPLWELDDQSDEEAMDDDDLDFDSSDQFADGPDGSASSAVAASTARVNINSAGVDELTELPGIGPALAERIIEYRQQRRFEDPSQLTRVQGIGPATLERIGSQVTVE